jgi:hypothetical protein
MKQLAVLGACLLTVMLGVPLASAQHEHPSPAAPTESQATPPEPGGQRPMGGQGPMGHGMMGEAGMQCPMMAMHMSMMHRMMHQSMGGQTDPATIGMAEALAGGSMDAPTMAHMLQMRGEILKAIGEIMLRHGQAMAEEK